MRKPLFAALAASFLLAAAGVQAQTADCDETFEAMSERLQANPMQTEEKHDLMSEMVGAYESCRNGDTTAWNRLQGDSRLTAEGSG